MSRRLIVVLVAALLTAGIFVSAAAAIAFTDDSCANDSGCRPPHGQVGSSYFHKVQIRPGGGTGPYTYSISAGSLPAGLSIGSSSGEITGHADGRRNVELLHRRWRCMSGLFVMHQRWGSAPL